MRPIYVGGLHKSKNKSKLKWKILFFLVALLTVVGSALKIAAPTIVEKWINEKGESASGYAFSVRESELSFGKGQVILKDVKFFNAKTTEELLEAPTVTLRVDLLDMIFSQNRNVSASADKVDLILSKDLTTELARLQSLGLNSITADVGKLNLIEMKEDQSRTVLELDAVRVSVKQAEFSLASKLANGGKLDLKGKKGTPWSISGSLTRAPSDIFNKITGGELPFAFTGPVFNAEISAQTNVGNISGVITPDIKNVNLLTVKPGIPTQSIKRVLTEELTFTLPFTLKDEVTLQYADSVAKLKAYRKNPAPNEEDTVSVRAAAPQVTEPPKKKKSFSFWPF